MFLEQHALVSKKQTSLTRSALALLATTLTGMLSACGGSANIPAATASGPQVYMSPAMAGGDAASATANLATYSIDDAAKTFVQDTYAFSDSQTGAQVQYAGNIAPFQRGLLSLAVTRSNKSYPKVTDGWAFELAGQAGGLAQFNGQPFVPLVPAVSCPAMSKPETFLFVTLPARMNTGMAQPLGWNPLNETAYGSADISASGLTVTLNNIAQHTLPSLSGGASGTPANPSPSSVTGACSSTVYGNTVSLPPQVTITNPGNGESVPPQALLGIGPSGLLVESNGNYIGAETPFYQNGLGAGTGAIGLPKPSSAVDTSSLVGAQYLGFFFGSGSVGVNPTNGNSFTTNGFSSVASFGFSSLPSTCASVAPGTSTTLYGGDFTNNDPTTSTTGYGICDFAIDLGAQDTSTNGLFPSATVYVGPTFAGNTTRTTTYSFPAVAIAGQLNGKYAIFLIGEDTVGSPNQPWGIYLLQSN